MNNYIIYFLPRLITFSAASRFWLRSWRQPMLKQILEFGSWMSKKILSASVKSLLSTHVIASSHWRSVSKKDIVSHRVGLHSVITQQMKEAPLM